MKKEIDRHCDEIETPRQGIIPNVLEFFDTRICPMPAKDLGWKK
ncbi:MAG: hypothetical protein Q4A75_07430 [Peptostreptococcaceae bacterium]|nr:hypothetical protein [Peptostreptococcaceae bacterium]